MSSQFTENPVQVLNRAILKMESEAFRLYLDVMTNLLNASMTGSSLFDLKDRTICLSRLDHLASRVVLHSNHERLLSAVRQVRKQIRARNSYTSAELLFYAAQLTAGMTRMLPVLGSPNQPENNQK